MSRARAFYTLACLGILVLLLAAAAVESAQDKGRHQMAWESCDASTRFVCALEVKGGRTLVYKAQGQAPFPLDGVYETDIWPQMALLCGGPRNEVGVLMHFGRDSDSLRPALHQFGATIMRRDTADTNLYHLRIGPGGLGDMRLATHLQLHRHYGWLQIQGPDTATCWQLSTIDGQPWRAHAPLVRD